jgi:hypothetical protein
MMHRRILLVVMTILLAAAALPASAAPPEQIADPFPFTGPDFENDLVIFVNTTRAEFCTPEQIAFEQAVADWLAGGMVGPFPEDPTPPPTGRVAFPAYLVETPQGVIANTRGTIEGLVMELWVLDDPDDRVGVGACLDTDDADELFASGTSTFRGVGTDFYGAVFEGTTRRPSFIDHTQGGGVVTTPDGDRYDYSWFFHQHIPCEDADPDPFCEVAHFQLRPLR